MQSNLSFIYFISIFLLPFLFPKAQGSLWKGRNDRKRLGCLFSGHSRTFTLVNCDSFHKIWERWSQTKPAWRGKVGTKFHPQLRSCFW